VEKKEVDNMEYKVYSKDKLWWCVRRGNLHVKKVKPSLKRRGFFTYMKNTPIRKYQKSGIKNWPKDERPREKLMRYGEHLLSDTELLAILLRSGVKGQSAIDLSRIIILRLGSFRNMSHTDLSAWKQFKGLGIAKISQIKAALEIGRRFNEQIIKDKKQLIKSSKDVVNILSPRLRDLKKEVFKILLLNSANRVIDIVEITQGSVGHVNPTIREIFQKALENFAASIICVHNHPSGDPSPSKEDHCFTNELVRAGKTLQIKLLDHIILGNNSYFSFKDKGKILPLI
jgi:DNA repair protein RadC